MFEGEIIPPFGKRVWEVFILYMSKGGGVTWQSSAKAMLADYFPYSSCQNRKKPYWSGWTGISRNRVEKKWNNSKHNINTALPLVIREVQYQKRSSKQS